MSRNSRPERPTFLRSKGERTHYEGVTTEDILDRLEDIFAGILSIEGEGLPEDMPAGYPMRALFRSGAIQIKKVGRLGKVLVPVKASLVGIYGTPLAAVPVAIPGMGPMSADLLQPSDKPVLWLPYCPRDRLIPYAEVMASCLRTLNQNITALAQPVIIQGTQGGEINAMVLEDQLNNTERVIPVLDKAAMQAQVLDLGAQDHTQNLIATFRAMYAECLTIMGVQGSGSEKASGMTSEETTCVMQQVNIVTYSLLDLAQQWCEHVNADARLECNISAVLGAGWTVSMEDDPKEAKQEGTEDAAEE